MTVLTWLLKEKLMIKSILTGPPEPEASLAYFSSSKNRDGMSFSEHDNQYGQYIYLYIICEGVN